MRHVLPPSAPRRRRRRRRSSSSNGRPHAPCHRDTWRRAVRATRARATRVLRRPRAVAPTFAAASTQRRGSLGWWASLRRNEWREVAVTRALAAFVEATAARAMEADGEGGGQQHRSELLVRPFHVFLPQDRPRGRPMTLTIVRWHHGPEQRERNVNAPFTRRFSGSARPIRSGRCRASTAPGHRHARAIGATGPEDARPPTPDIRDRPRCRGGRQNGGRRCR